MAVAVRNGSLKQRVTICHLSGMWWNKHRSKFRYYDTCISFPPVFRLCLLIREGLHARPEPVQCHVFLGRLFGEDKKVHRVHEVPQNPWRRKIQSSDISFMKQRLSCRIIWHLIVGFNSSINSETKRLNVFFQINWYFILLLLFYFSYSSNDTGFILI